MTGVLGIAVAAQAGSVEVPLDISAGPSIVALTGKASRGDRLHMGIGLSARTIWDRDALAAIGQEGFLARESDEVRRNPAWWAPDLVVLPVSAGPGSAAGASWRPIAVGVPVVKRGPLRLEVTAGARFTVLSLTRETSRGLPGLPEEPSDLVVPSKPTPSTAGSEKVRTLFLRPGVDLRVGAEVALSSSFLLSADWTSMLHLPQRVGGGIGQFGKEGERLAHIGSGLVALHYRLPVTVR